MNASRVEKSHMVHAPFRILAVFPAEGAPPRSLAERLYTIGRWTEMKTGGHFAALEQPEALVQDIRVFFRSLRNS